MLAANLRTRDGEIDLIVGDRSRHWIVEVKCGTTDSPLDRIDDEKEARLWRLARAVRAEGVLLVEVRLSADAVLVGISPG